MARKNKSSSGESVEDFRYGEARRRNNPPAGIAPTYEVREHKTQTYAYDPHLDPQLVWADKAELNQALGKDWKEWKVLRETPHPLWPETPQKAYRRLLEIRHRLEPEAFERMRRTASFPFKPGEHKRIAARMVDFRGNEVVRVMALDGIGYKQRGIRPCTSRSKWAIIGALAN